MAEYIERGAVIYSIEKMRLKYQTNRMYRGVRFGIDSAINYIKLAPTADVVDIIHGEWLATKIKGCSEVFECSECGYSFEHEGYQHFFNYCPNCGAKMDGDSDA